MSTMKRLWNVARGTTRIWRDGESPEDPAVERELAEARLKPAAPRRPSKLSQDGPATGGPSPEGDGGSSVGPPERNANGTIKKTL